MKQSPLLRVASVVVAALWAVPAFAQDTSFSLPDQCLEPNVTADIDHAAMGHSAAPDLIGQPDHVRENMEMMAITMGAMETGMLIENANVAFACAMIAHHQGAIDMANVLIEHGDDPQMIQLAQDIIAAQNDEIAFMTNWLVENVK